MIDNDALDAEYMKLHSIHQVFERLTKELVLQRPEDVYGTLVTELQKISAEKKSDHSIVFVIGGPKIGKTTFCQMLAEEYGFVHLDASSLASNLDDVVPLLKAKILASPPQSVVLVDGFPTTLKQAIHFEMQIAPCKCVLHLEASKDYLLSRASGENGGNPPSEDILKRISQYTDDSTALFVYYKACKKLVKMSAEQEAEELWNQINHFFGGGEDDEVSDLWFHYSTVV